MQLSKTEKKRVLQSIEGRLGIQKLQPAEWHQFVYNYNYDNGLKPFTWLVKQSTLDQGSALCLYWHLQPGIRSPEDSDRIALLRQLEKNFLGGFYQTGNYAFDPQDDFGDEASAASGMVPQEMQRKTAGQDFPRESVETACLRPPQEKEWKKIQKKIQDAEKILQGLNPDFTDSAAPGSIVQQIQEAIKPLSTQDPASQKKALALSYLWHDCVKRQYAWEWTMWAAETSARPGVSHPLKHFTCLADTLIHHTLSGFQPVKIISQLFNKIGSIPPNNTKPINLGAYDSIGLIFQTAHLKYDPNPAPAEE